ncbi:hypothetical protein [Petropleomorpha daqingensis]|uniref:DUF559 domain-containing protein n=1 Tax=Petropleomorpha daqingensis TaxID=2026353 RepID=A0A853CL27_9ACTN|nr:hypothetical protein [Petropleomorpha daqingensis]
MTRGAYVSQALPLSVHAACTAALGVLPDGAVVSHLTAAALLGAPVPHRWPLQFSVPPGTYRARRDRLRIHVRTLEASDVVLHRGLPMTSGAQTWLDLAAVLPARDLVAVGDALWRAERFDAQGLAERVARADGVRGVVRARQWAPVLTPKAASRPESLLRVALIEGDVPDPEPQVPILDRWGREVVHADLGYPEWQVALEYEGRQHAERDQFRADLDRYTLTAADGWLLLRFGDLHIDRPWTVVDRTARALRSRGARW